MEIENVWIDNGLLRRNVYNNKAFLHVLVVYAEDGGAGYDMMVKNCFAYDSTNFKTANKIR